MIKNILLLFCTVSLVAHSSLIFSKQPNTLFQSGTLISLSNAVLDGSDTVYETNKYGNLGLGTINGAKGEMVLVDGNVYLSDQNGNAKKISANEKTPFAMIVHFQPEIVLTLHDIKNIDELEKAIDQHLPGMNYFYAIKIEGIFSEIKARSFDPEEKPYQPLPEWLKKHEHIFYVNNMLATIVGFRSPDFSSNISLPGYHFHFLSNDQRKVGHVYDLRIKDAKVSIEIIKDFHLLLPDTKNFQGANLKVFSNETISAMEKNK